MLLPGFGRLGQQCLKDCQQLAERLAHSMCTTRYRGCLVTHPVQGLASGRGNRLKRLGTYKLGMGLVEFTQQLGVVNSHGQVVGHGLHSSDVVRAKSVLLNALYRDCPQHLVVHNQRQNHLGAGVRQVRILKTDAFFPDVKRNARLARTDGPGDQRIALYFQLMALSEHSSSSLATSGAQDGPAAGFVNQEYTGVVKTVGITNDVHGLGQQGTQISDRRYLPPDLVGSLQQPGPAFGLTQEINLRVFSCHHFPISHTVRRETTE